MLKGTIATTLIAVFLCLLFLPLFCASGFLGENVVARADEYFIGELLSSFSTDFGFSSEGRKSNIRKATSLINGKVVGPSEIFSFNDTTGKRTLENGYKSSPTIEEGKYVLGVGGGVCQVSTTLYNAVVRAGLKIDRVYPHSLPVSYVKPSMDAMVSSATDFRFFNDTPYHITIKGDIKGTILTFRIYGFKTVVDGEKITFRSVVVEKLVATYDEICDENAELGEDEEFRIIKKGVDGLVSECYKETYYQDKLVSSTRIRRDVYKAQNGIKLVRKENSN